MKLRYGSIVLVLMVFIAIVVAGCTSSGPSATPTPGPGGLTLRSLVDTSKVKWYDYNITTPIPGMPPIGEDMRVDYGVDYNGSKADKYRVAVNLTILNNTTNSVTEIYMNHTTDAVVGGHTKTTMNGNVTEQDLPAVSGSGQGGQDPLLISGNSTLTSMGTESVTVPAGTYSASKYGWTNNGSTGYVWIAPGVPVPVKMEYSQQDVASSMSLVGWG